MFVDLRHTALPAGDVTLRVRAGVRRTLVALPHDRCVHVDSTSTRCPFAAARRVRAGRRRPDHARTRPCSASVRPSERPRPTRGARRRGPTLASTSPRRAGACSCATTPTPSTPHPADWPGYEVCLEPRPDTQRAAPSRRAQPMLAAWRARHAAQVRRRRVERADARARARPKPMTSGEATDHRDAARAARWPTRPGGDRRAPARCSLGGARASRSRGPARRRGAARARPARAPCWRCSSSSRAARRARAAGTRRCSLAPGCVAAAGASLASRLLDGCVRRGAARRAGPRRVGSCRSR